MKVSRLSEPEIGADSRPLGSSTLLCRVDRIDSDVLTCCLPRDSLEIAHVFVGVIPFLIPFSLWSEPDPGAATRAPGALPARGGAGELPLCGHRAGTAESASVRCGRREVSILAKRNKGCFDQNRPRPSDLGSFCFLKPR